MNESQSDKYETVSLDFSCIFGFLLRIWMSSKVIATNIAAYAPPNSFDMAAYLTLSDELFYGKIPVKLLFDSRRNYGRTTSLDFPQANEAVIRLTVEP